MHRLGPPAAVALIAALDALWASAAADCICRAQGRQFELGQTVCLSTPKGPRLATCGMALNNTSWQFTEASCAVSEVSPLGESQVAMMERLFHLGSESEGGSEIRDEGH